MIKPYLTPPREFLLSQLAYEAETGKLWWRVKCNGRFLDRPAGSRAQGPKPYVKVHLQGRQWVAHRLIWKMVHGQDVPDGMTIDHINRKHDDNRLCNLRLATGSEQAVNRKTRADSGSGFKGVVKFENRWRLHIIRKTGERDRRVFACLGQAIRERNRYYD